MATKPCTGASAAPLFLRLSLGIIFICAGLGKVMESGPVKGEAAATLANMGVLEPAGHAVPGVVPVPDTTPVVKPVDKSTSRPAPIEPLPDKPAKAKTPPPLMEVYRAGPSGTKSFTADDFPEEVQVKNVYGLAVMLKSMEAAPEGSKHPFPLLPAFATSGRWPVYLAWACALSELVGGLFILFGAVTRLSAFAVAFNMAMAMWLTQIGPAMQLGDTIAGFLPNHPLVDQAWQVLMFQFALFCSAIALMYLGSGALGIDRMLFPPSIPSARPAPKAEAKADAH